MKLHQKKWNGLRRALALLLCIGLLSATAPGTACTTAYANNELDGLNSKYDKLEKEQKELQNKIDKAKNDKEKQLAIKQKTAREIEILQEQIVVLGDKIIVLEQDIADREAEISALTSDIDNNYELFKQRMRAIYMSDTGSMLGMVLGADSYGDYLSRSETVKRVAEHDKALIAKLTADKEKVEGIKAKLDVDRSDLDAAKQSVEAKNGELDKRLATTETNIQNLDELEKQFLEDKEKTQAAMKAVQEEIDAVYAAMEQWEAEFVGGGFAVPVQYSYISSYYGYRFGGSDYHTGIDFAGGGILGKPVRASNSGVVAVTQENYVNGRRGGYGRYMIVDHGGGYSTLYAHLSAITVPQGTRVSKGQVIGKVGSTGWSTGPHLHFEIRINGKHQNPVDYLNVR
ncbi:MAG: peptidoglycan DD-metalloendopeptidase family protein [Angelakisella sp.]